MKEDIIELKKEFERIKKMGLIKSLRSGYTGVGYTFESLLNKPEDQESKPDYKSIELKCKYGYSKSALTLFNSAPKRFEESANKYIYETYANHRYNNEEDILIFERKVFHKYVIERNHVYFRVFVNYDSKTIIMKSYKDGEFIEDVCYWDFMVLEEKLNNKISTLALVDAYPYKRDDATYYKYLKMTIYKLKGFSTFLKLIEQDKIHICFYFKEANGSNANSYNEFKDHGVAFRIKLEYIDELFYKI